MALASRHSIYPHIYLYIYLSISPLASHHVSSRAEHCKVSSNGSTEGHLHPLVRGGVWEGRCEHLADRNIGSNVGEEADDCDEPVDARDGAHLIGAVPHTESEEFLRDASVVEGADEEELANEEKKKAVVDFGKGSLGLGDEFL